MNMIGVKAMHSTVCTLGSLYCNCRYHTSVLLVVLGKFQNWKNLYPCHNEHIHINVGIHPEYLSLLQHITCCPITIELMAWFCHEMSTLDYAIHHNDLGIWMVMACWMLYAVHPCHWVDLTKSHEPFNVDQQVRELAELWGEVKDSMHLSNAQTCYNNRTMVVESRQLELSWKK